MVCYDVNDVYRRMMDDVTSRPTPLFQPQSLLHRILLSGIKSDEVARSCKRVFFSGKGRDPLLLGMSCRPPVRRVPHFAVS